MEELKTYRRKVIEKAEAAKNAEDYITAIKNYDLAAELSKKLKEKESAKELKKISKQLLDLEIQRRKKLRKEMTKPNTER